MFFKVVQTIEKGKLNLSIVPSAWENQGILQWPKTKVDKLIQNKSSLPEKDWIEMSCILKRTNLKNYKDAEQEVRKMCEADDTEGIYSSDNERISSKRKRSSNVHTLTCPIPDFNNLVPPNASQSTASSFVVQEKEFLPKYGEPVYQSNILVENDIPQTQQSYVFIEEDGSTREILNINETISTITDTNAKFVENNLEKKIDSVIANQVVMMQGLAKLEIMFDEIVKQIDRNQSKSNRTDMNSLSILPNPIDTFEEFTAFEEKLKDRNILEDFVKEMSFICGSSGKGNGIDHCYMLIDKFFTRKFMTLCSWAGGSRDNKDNIPFKFYKNITSAFFQIIRLADNDFSLESCEQFLKNVIRNKTRRNESELVRSSKSKKRPRNISYKIKDTRKGNLPEAEVGADDSVSNKQQTDDEEGEDEASADQIV